MTETEILDLFNQITGHRHRPTKSNLKGIKRVLTEEYTVEEITHVIQLKTVQWKNNPVMSGNLNPITIFRDIHWDKYINEVENVKNNPQMYGEYFKKINNVATSAADDADGLAAMYG